MSRRSQRHLREFGARDSANQIWVPGTGGGYGGGALAPDPFVVVGGGGGGNGGPGPLPLLTTLEYVGVTGLDIAATNIQPPEVYGLHIAYFGSMGEHVMVVKLGGAGDEQIPGVVDILVKLGDAGPITLDWDPLLQYYHDVTALNLWNTLGADVGNHVGWQIEAL
jgi:hypothetical protein